MKKLLSLALKIVGITLGLVGIVHLLNFIPAIATYIHRSIWLIIALSAAIALIIAVYNAFALSKASQSAQGFAPLFLVSMVIRLFLSLGAITFLIFRFTDDRIVLVLNFFIVYLFYLVFEIYGIIGNLRPISNQGEIND